MYIIRDNYYGILYTSEDFNDAQEVYEIEKARNNFQSMEDYYLNLVQVCDGQEKLLESFFREADPCL